MVEISNGVITERSESAKTLMRPVPAGVVTIKAALEGEALALDRATISTFVDAGAASAPAQ